MPATSVPQRQEEELERVWGAPRGLLAWFQPVNNRTIGRRFIVTAFVFFLLAGLQALLIRVQLARPDSGFLDPTTYNQLFTMHGTAMMFLFAVPMAEGLGIYLAPMMIGARDMALPRLNAFGYYIYLIGGVVFFLSFFLGVAPDAGWFNYVPLASDEFSPGIGVDIYTTMITFIEVSALVAAVELVATILKCRAPGMSLDRMPVFVWSILIMGLVIIFAMPGVIVASVSLSLDRSVDTRFFLPGHDGDPLLWQHLFWWFGHPEVYLILIPALGVVSSIVTISARRRLFGYTAIVLSTVAIGIISFGVWVHHMFTVGIPDLADSFFTAASLVIVIPSVIQIFCWIATLWGTRPRLTPPLLFVLAFLLIFSLGGLTGMTLASVPFDTQVHDTFYVVGHFHYVLIGGVVFPVFAALHHWFPKFTGRMLHEGLARWTVGVMFVGFNLTFFPMHQLGFQGMPRRIYTYVEGMGWEGPNLVITTGAFLFAAGVALFLVNVFWSRVAGERAGPDPWKGDTLEWLTDSPPRAYGFLEPPAVEGRYALWDRSDPDVQPVVAGLHTDRREIVLTEVLSGEAQAVGVLPGPSPWPFLMAAGASVGFIGYMFAPWVIVLGFILACAASLGWLWPRRPWDREELQ